MQVSILIVSKNRKEEQEFTLNVLARRIDASLHEVLVFLDGYADSSSVLEDKMNWAEVDDVGKTASLINQVYQLWKQNPANLLLNRGDLTAYLSADYLKKTVLSLSDI